MLNEIPNISDLLGDVLFSPSTEQQKVKAAFYADFNDAPICDTSDITASIAIQVTGDHRLRGWWSLPGFQEWFRNSNEFRQRIEFLAQRSLDELEEIMSNQKLSPNARLKAIELALKYADKMPKGGTDRFLDEDVGKMSVKQLRQYIERQAPKLLEEEQYETSEISDDIGEEIPNSDSE